MPRGRSITQNTALNNAAETVVAILSGLSPKDADTIDLEGVVQVLGGTNGTDVRVRIRRGVDTTGTLVGFIFRVDAVGAVNVQAVAQVSDQPPASANLSYVLTVVNTGATAAGSAVVASLNAVYGV